MQHNKILRERQKELIEEEEVYLRKRLRDVEMDVNRPNLEIISAILKSFNACFHQTLNGPGRRKEYPYLLSVDTTSNTSQVVARLREAAEQVCDMASRYTVRKGDRARLGLEQAIESIVSDVDAEGEAKWQHAVTSMSEGWQEGGEHYNRFVAELTEKDREEDALIQSYVADQTSFAKGIAERELRMSMRTAAESADMRVRDLAARASAMALQSRDRLFTMLERDELTFFEDDKGLSGDLGLKVSDLFTRISKSSGESARLFRNVAATAKEVAVLRHGRETLPFLREEPLHSSVGVDAGAGARTGTGTGAE